MTTGHAHLHDTAELLSHHFLLDYPAKAARACANLVPRDAAELLQKKPAQLAASVIYYLPSGAIDSIFRYWNPEAMLDTLLMMDVQQASCLLARLKPDLREQLLQQLEQHNPNVAKEFRDIMAYPEDTAGRLMDPVVQLFADNLTVEEVLDQIKLRRPKQLDVIFLVDQQHKLTGSLFIGDLVLAGSRTTVATLAKPITQFAYAIDAEEDIVEKFEELKLTILPILNVNEQIVGVIRTSDIYQQTREDLTSDITSMVGVSKDEKALSSSLFAVKKRMPWLQINLLTAFAAAAVVGAFESIIAQFTALAILLPVAAGQSGNAGAQALAVTMRGLTLKEITVRHWWKVFRKESAVGLMNGVAIAITCSIGVFVWSQSLGLALVMTLAMITSLTIACGAGALVPILLKRFGLDPAQSSSIVLTTVTDIAGFLSFLGIATLFASMLPTT